MSEEEMKKKKWKEIRSICLLSIQRQYSHLSDSAVADNLSMSRATFNRIKNDENNIPTSDNIVKLLVGSKNKALVWDAIGLINGHFKKMAQEVQEEAPTKKAPVNRKILETLEMQALLNVKENFIVYELASLFNGTTDEQILRVLGNKGLKALGTLLKKNIIFQTKDKYHVYDKSILVRNNNALKRQLEIFLGFYDSSSCMKEKGNCIVAFSDGLNEDALKRLQEEYSRHYRKVEDIYRDPKSLGKIPSFSGGFCDVLDRIT